MYVCMYVCLFFFFLLLLLLVFSSSPFPPPPPPSSPLIHFFFILFFFLLSVLLHPPSSCSLSSPLPSFFFFFFLLLPFHCNLSAGDTERLTGMLQSKNYFTPNSKLYILCRTAVTGSKRTSLRSRRSSAHPPLPSLSSSSSSPPLPRSLFTVA